MLWLLAPTPAQDDICRVGGGVGGAVVGLRVGGAVGEKLHRPLMQSQLESGSHQSHA